MLCGPVRVECLRPFLLDHVLQVAYHVILVEDVD